MWPFVAGAAAAAAAEGEAAAAAAAVVDPAVAAAVRPSAVAGQKGSSLNLQNKGGYCLSKGDGRLSFERRKGGGVPGEQLFCKVG